MARQRELSAVVLLAAAVACGGAPSRGRALRPGEAAPGPAIGLAHSATRAEGVLGYEVELHDGGDGVLSAELALRFALVDRDGDGRERWRVDLGPSDYDVTDLAIDGDRAWVASMAGTVRAFDLATGAARERWHLGAAASAVDAAGAYVVTGTTTGVLCLRRAADAALLQCAVAHDGPISAIDLGDGVVATASLTGEVALFELPSLRVLARRRVAGSANDVDLAPDGRALAVARSASPPRRSPVAVRRERDVGVDGVDPFATVALFEIVPSGDRVQLVPGAIGRGHGAPVTAVAFSPDGRRVVSASWDRSVRLWSAADGIELARFGGFDHLVRDLDVDDRGHHAAAAAWATEAGKAAIVLLDLMYD